MLDAMRKYQPKTATLLAGLPAFEAMPTLPPASPKSFPCAKTSRWIMPFSNARATLSAWRAMNSAGATSGAGTLFTSCCRATPAPMRRGPGRLVSAADSSGNYIDCGRKLVALLGVKNLIVVDTPDALLVADRSRAQQVGDIVKLLEKNRREELL